VKILFVVPYVPSLIRVRPFQLIRHLSARGHAVTVVTLWTNDRERRDVEELRKCCAEVRALYLPTWRSLVNCVQALSTVEPLQARYSWSAPLQQLVADARRDADVVHVEHLRGARYGLNLAPATDSSGAPIIWDSVDCISDLFEQAVRRRRDAVGKMINRIEIARTRRYEGMLVSRFDRVLVSSAVDQKSLHSLARTGDDRVTVLTNGVDLDYFTPADESRRPDTIVFSGKMSYHANESAVLHLIRDVMPRVWATRPRVGLVVVGKDPSRNLRRVLASESSRVTVTGTVPDIRPYLRGAAIAAVPLVYGAGCQNKVLEAMACGTPVVATPQAVSALRAQSGKDALVAEGPQAFADALLALLENPRRRQEIGQAGRRYVEAYHRWDDIAGRLETIYRGVLAERDGSRNPVARLSA
jgi:sugar transferase (PEP-CTERM/EpsH1 system associated)